MRRLTPLQVLDVLQSKQCHSPRPQSTTLLGLDPGSSKEPWVPDEVDECQMKFCHHCRPTCSIRASLSLDGVAKGDLSPSAAVGFGFHLQGVRLVASANVVSNIGFRAVPWVSHSLS